MSLFKYYSLDECSSRKAILKILNEMTNNGLIEYTLDGDIFKLIDIDLDEYDIDELNEVFEENDVFPYLDRDGDDYDERDDFLGMGFDEE